jgi:hypothetical protein
MKDHHGWVLIFHQNQWQGGGTYGNLFRSVNGRDDGLLSKVSFF